MKGLPELEPTDISIHALREESDAKVINFHSPDGKFQSTPSARRATVDALCLTRCYVISIHALREESDPLYSVPGLEKL